MEINKRAILDICIYLSVFVDETEGASIREVLQGTGNVTGIDVHNALVEGVIELKNNLYFLTEAGRDVIWKS